MGDIKVDAQVFNDILEELRYIRSRIDEVDMRELCSKKVKEIDEIILNKEWMSSEDSANLMDKL